jgi:hypothetical protein
MTKSTSTLLVAILVILTFPIWIGLAGGLFGLVGGLLGALFGIMGAIFGAIFGGIASLFDWIFGGMFHWPHYHGWHISKLCTIALVILLIALAVRTRKKAS